MNSLFGLSSNNSNMIQQFIKFAKNFKGNPEQAVEQMLANGEITQEQYNTAVNRARQLEPLLKQFIK